MSTVKVGDAVKVHYTVSFDDGQVFDSSEGGEPLSFTVGLGNEIPGVEQALLGMQVGETKSVVIPPDLAYGQYSEEGLRTVDRHNVGLTGVEIEVGSFFEMGTPEGPIPLRIAEVTDTTVTLDFNHPLSGEDLHYVLTLVEIELGTLETE